MSKRSRDSGAAAASVAAAVAAARAAAAAAPAAGSDSAAADAPAAASIYGPAPGFFNKRRRVEPSQIGNKQKRSEVFHKQRTEKKKEQRKARNVRQAVAAELGDKAPPKQQPHTLDNTRELDDTVVAPDDEEVLRDEAGDELAGYFAGTAAPKIMITTKMVPSAQIFQLIGELLNLIPNSFYYRRGRYPVGKISQFASNKQFTHLLVLSERAKVPNGCVRVGGQHASCCWLRVDN